MIERYKTIIAQAKLHSIGGELTKSGKRGLLRVAGNMGISEGDALSIIRETKAAEKVEGRK